MKPNETFQRLYGGGKRRAELNRAIAAEWPDGNDLIDAMEMVATLRRQGATPDPQVVAELYDLIDGMRAARVEAIRVKYWTD